MRSFARRVVVFVSKTPTVSSCGAMAPLSYVSPSAFSLAGYLDSDPNLPRSPELCGPEMTPSRIYPGPAMTASGTIPASELPSSSVLMLGKP